MASHKQIFTTSMQITIISLVCLSPTTKANVVENTCKGDQLCLSILNQDPKASTAKDTRELAEIGLQIAIKNVTDSEKFTQQLAEKTPDPQLKQQLSSCADAFKGASRQYNAALGDLTDDPFTASYDVFVSRDGPNYCKEGLEKMGFKVDSVFVRVDHVFTFYKVLTMVIDQVPKQPRF